MEAKVKLLNVINQISTLLSSCGWKDKSDWFQQKRSALEPLEPDSIEFKAILKEIRDILVGMGSFSDLPMMPEKGSHLSRRQASTTQWDLATQLAELIANEFRK
jgi:hypothetical protein